MDVNKLNCESCPISKPSANSDILMWVYYCSNCEAYFETTVPKGPREEKQTTCPMCNSKDIERFDTTCCEIAPPGG